MKINILYLFAFVALLSTYSCGNEADTSADSSPLKTRALASDSEEAAQEEDLSYSYISRKWELGEEYMDLSTEGSFEAVLDGKHVEGRWGFSYGTDDKKILKLIGKEDKGDNNSFNRSYEIIDVSYERFVAIDSEGNKINFLAGE